MLAKQITDRERFLKIVAQAIADAERNCKKESERNRWVRAIAKAVAHIEENGEFMNYDETENHLVIWSQESNAIYAANGVCGCKAYTDGLTYRKKPYPCFHRAAARLMRIYMEAENKVIEVPLSQGKVALIDAEDAERVLQHKWTLFSRNDRRKTSEYAVRYLTKDGKRTSQGLHRFIMNEPEGLEVDHENRNGLDNRKSNLRIATRAQNAQNATRAHNSTGFKGVYFHKGNQQFHACINANGKKYSCGYYETAEAAAHAYDAKAKELHKEFAVLNFPESANDSQAVLPPTSLPVSSFNCDQDTFNTIYLGGNSEFITSF